MASTPDAWLYLDANVGLYAPPAPDVWAYTYDYAQDTAVVWPTTTASFEIGGITQALFLSAGPLWIKATLVVQPHAVWLPDPTVIPEVYVPGYWGILLQNNPDSP